jgi:putative nucleotidyltransferase with HDIG domain
MNAKPAPAARPAIDHGKLGEQLVAIVQKRIATNTLVLPSLPTIALKCLNLIRSPNFSLKDASTIVEKDPLLAAQVMRAANSAALATREPAKTILNALSRLGVDKLRTLLVEVSAHKVFESKDQRIAQACRGLWDHSLAVAALGRDIVALGGGGGEPDVAYLAGLLHDVGKPVVASLLLEAEKMAVGGWTSTNSSSWIESSAWISVIQSTHRKVGVALAEKWELPEAVVKGIRDCGDYDAADRPCAANTVRFANAIAKREGLYVGPVDHDDNNALIMVGTSLLGFEEDFLKRVCHGLKERMKEAAA